MHPRSFWQERSLEQPEEVEEDVDESEKIEDEADKEEDDDSKEHKSEGEEEESAEKSQDGEESGEHKSEEEAEENQDDEAEENEERSRHLQFQFQVCCARFTRCCLYVRAYHANRVAEARTEVFLAFQTTAKTLESSELSSGKLT